ncbi:MAG: hypothetical protein EA391_01995 [Balneolaceae bacterium]|nr:MAG: hypothetical protein EA391_01995 [Balneolaceae bacterium]
MKRKIFFFIEKLEINRSERIAISLLFATLVLLTSINALYKPSVTTDPGYYAELEAVFLERSAVAEQEHRQIMARYEPAAEPQLPGPAADLSEADTTKRVNRIEERVDSGEKININTATAEELQALPGIGPAFAQRIIDWREENGKFTSKEQLLEIRGIGERRLEVMKPLITL